jgi:hypothetical protein
VYFAPSLQIVSAPHFSDPDRFTGLQSLFLNLGSALIGAAAIAFSLVMFAMQVNVERMPHGLFRKFNADKRLLITFAGTFLLAIYVASASLIPDTSWVAAAILASTWGIVLIFLLFLYAYRRALLLINPIQQLSLLVEDSRHRMQIWVRRAKRAAGLIEGTNSAQESATDPLASTHDLPRITFFRANPYWTTGAHKAVQHAISFARRYAEHGDHEVSRAALTAVVNVNESYAEAKGKTFFADHPFVDNPLTTDGFINNTLELLRQNIRVGISRGDEQLIEQTMQAMAALVGIYVRIDYSISHASKTHAHIAAGYLSEAVKTVAPHNMTDVMMEGVRLMGQSAHLLLSNGEPPDIVTLVSEIGVIASLGAVNEKYRPVTMISLEQFAKLTFNLVRSNAHDIGFAADKLKENVTMVAKFFLQIPDTPLSNVHQTYLAPYYSITTTQSLPSLLTGLVNTLTEASPDDEAAKTIIRNIEDWADGLYRTEKVLLLLAIEKRSHFTFDIIHWITHVTKVLLALSNIPACDEHTRDKLREHAIWLISTLSFIPDDRETASFIESYQITETLFEAALDAYRRNCFELSEKVRELLLQWAFKGGRHHTGWAILERSFYGLATLALIIGNPQVIDKLKSELSNQLTQPEAPDQEICDRTAREIRRRAATLYQLNHSLHRIEHEMSRIDSEKLQPLLQDLANILSPGTMDEPVDLAPF